LQNLNEIIVKEGAVGARILLKWFSQKFITLRM